MNRLIPWWAKIGAKIVLSRVPLDYRVFARLGMFRHGWMNDAEYALRVFRSHFDRVDFPRKSGGFIALELGPGDSLASAILADAHGAARCYMIDVGNFATADVGAYCRLAQDLRSSGVAAQDLAHCRTMDELLASVNGVYLTEGLESIRAVPADSVDFIWSQAVLEHIRLADFDALLDEQFRVLKPDGVASHRIDLKDHLAGSLNNLRFSEKTWESPLMAESGFYTNRIRYPDLLRRFEHAGFVTNVLATKRWDRLPMPRAKLASEFTEYSDDDLRVSSVDVVLHKQRHTSERSSDVSDVVA